MTTENNQNIEITEEPKKNLKNIYKRTLAEDLIKLGNTLHHTMRNKNNPKYQVFVFEDTPKLIQDMLYITQQGRYIKRFTDTRLYA